MKKQVLQWDGNSRHRKETFLMKK